jgi:hypothetical protein
VPDGKPEQIRIFDNFQKDARTDAVDFFSTRIKKFAVKIKIQTSFCRNNTVKGAGARAAPPRDIFGSMVVLSFLGEAFFSLRSKFRMQTKLKKPISSEMQVSHSLS